MRKSSLFLILFILAACTAVNAYGPPGFIPDGPHPRIWLTASELSDLNDKQSASDPAWTDLEAWCDAHLNDSGYDAGDVNWKGYRGGGYHTYLLNYALAYQVLKDDNPTKAATYATYARSILNGIRTGMSVGEEVGNGLRLIRCGETSDRTINRGEATALGIDYATYKLGYSARYVSAGALAYDWLYDELTAQEKSDLAAMLYTWFDWIRGVRSAYNNGVLVAGTRYFEDVDGDCTGGNNCTTNTAGTLGYGYGNVANNFMGGEYHLMSLIPLATYGDNPDAPIYFSAAKDLLNNTMKAQLSDDTKLSGGDSPEGWNYGSGFWYVLSSMYGHYTATGEDIFEGFSWPSDLIKALLGRSASNLVDVPIYGDWTGIPLGENRLNQVLPIVGINQRIDPSSTESKVGKYLLDNVDLGTTADWAKMLWPKEGASAPPSVLPLFYRATGNGYVGSRSSWADASDTVLGTVRLEGKLSASHEEYDEGTLYIMRGQDRLLTHQNMAGASVSANTIVFNNKSHQASNPTMAAPAIDRIQNGTDFMYVSGDITNAWKRPWKPDGAKLFRRSFVHIRPNLFVVYDVTRSNPAEGFLKEWYTQFEADPTTSADTVTVTKGGSKAFVKTIFPAGGTITKTAPAAGFWRVKYTPTNLQEYDQFLHVIEATGKNQAEMTKTVRIDASTGNMRGAYIADAANPANNWVALFTADQTGAAVNSEVKYQIPVAPGHPPIGRAPKQIIVDLVPSADYTMIGPRNKNAPQEYTLKPGAFPGEGRVYKASSQGVIYIETVESPSK